MKINYELAFYTEKLQNNESANESLAGIKRFVCYQISTTPLIGDKIFLEIGVTLCLNGEPEH